MSTQTAPTQALPHPINTSDVVFGGYSITILDSFVFVFNGLYDETAGELRVFSYQFRSLQGDDVFHDEFNTFLSFPVDSNNKNWREALEAAVQPLIVSELAKALKLRTKPRKQPIWQRFWS